MRSAELARVFSLRQRAFLSTVTLVVGALLVGDAIHGAAVAGIFGITSPAAVGRVGGGALLIWIGYRLRVAPEDYASMPSDETADDDGSAGDFDPELSPIGETIDDAERGKNQDR